MQLLEREAFLAALDDYTEDAASGSGRLVVVTGEPGIGKTSLVDAFREARPDVRWLWGACDGSFTPRPLGPLREILDQLGGDASSLTYDDDRHKLFAGFVSELESSTGTTGVVIEDLHWADEATLDWLRFLARRVERTRTLVVVTLRDAVEDLEPAHQQTMAQLATHRSTRRLTLPPLSPDAVRTLAGSGSAQAERLFALTGGNPFYVIETLTAPGDEVPRSVADVVAGRLQGLSPDAQRVLQTAALLVRPQSVDVLSAVSGRPAHVIDECLNSGTLVADGTSIRFRHELTRRAVEDFIPAILRAELHRAALRALEHDGADVAQLAHHAAGANHDDKALRYGAAAGDEAAAVSSHLEAAAQYARALDHAGSADTTTLAELHEKLATTHSLRDHWEESLVHREAALSLRRELGAAEQISANLRALTICHWRLCHGPETMAAINECFEMMRDGPDCAERGWALALYTAFDAEPEQAGRLLREVVAIAERFDDTALSAYAQLGLGADAYTAGGDGTAFLEKALAMFLEIGDSQRAAGAYTNLYEFGVDSLRLDESAWVYEEAMPYVADHDIATYTFCLRATHGDALVKQARHQEAIALLEGMRTETMSPINRCHMLLPLGTARLRAGDRAGLDDLRAAWDLATTSDDPDWMVHAATAMARAAWLLDQPSLLDESMLAALTREDFFYAFARAEYAVWLRRLGLLTVDVPDVPAPWSLELAGDHRGAAAVWAERGCVFDQAASLASSGDPDACREAVELFTELGSDIAADRARRILRAAGEQVRPRSRTRRSTRDHPAGLTAREAEVLELMTEDLTNSEIAQRLFLSPRTVDHHVSNVLAKLGVASRADAVTQARLLTV